MTDENVLCSSIVLYRSCQMPPAARHSHPEYVLGAQSIVGALYENISFLWGSYKLAMLREVCGTSTSLVRQWILCCVDEHGWMIEDATFWNQYQYLTYPALWQECTTLQQYWYIAVALNGYQAFQPRIPGVQSIVGGLYKNISFLWGSLFYKIAMLRRCCTSLVMQWILSCVE